MNREKFLKDLGVSLVVLTAWMRVKSPVAVGTETPALTVAKGVASYAVAYAIIRGLVE